MAGTISFLLSSADSDSPCEIYFLNICSSVLKILWGPDFSRDQKNIATYH